MKPDDKKSKAPDGGYGWVVVICAGIIGGMAATFFRCVGQVYGAMIEKSTFSRIEIATACILPRAIMALIATVGCKLGEVYSFRGTMFFGVIIAGIGMLLSSFSTFNISLFTLTFGVFIGVGCGLTMPLSSVVTGLYFTKRRSFAIGIMLCISNIIGFFLPPLLQFLFDQYELEGGLLLWAGIWLQGCIGALLIRYPKWALKGKFSKMQEELPLSTEELNKFKVSEDEHDKLKGLTEEHEKIIVRAKENEKVTVFTEDQKVSSPSVEKQKKSTKVERNLVGKNTSEQKFNCTKFVVFILKEIRGDMRYFKNYVFILLLINRTAMTFGLISTYLIFPRFAMEQNQNITHTQAAFLLSLMSIGDILARPISGWIMSIIPSHAKIAYLVSLILVGVSQCAFQFAQSYTSFIICSTVFGIFNGYTLVGYFNAIFQIFGPKQISGVNALHVTTCGLIIMTSAPIMTTIRNLTGSYSHCLTFVSIFNIATVILWLVEPLYFKLK